MGAAHLKQSSTTFVSPKTKNRDSQAAFTVPFYEEFTSVEKKSNAVKSGMLKINGK